MIPPDEPKLPEWKPALFEGRWVVWRTSGDNLQRSAETFGNRSTALVVAETLNGEQRERMRKMLKDMLKKPEEKR